MSDLKCFWCERPATCYGTYEGHTGYACDECCGHGCEDGWCDQLRNEQDDYHEVCGSCDECGGDIDRDEAIEGLCDQCSWWRHKAIHG